MLKAIETILIFLWDYILWWFAFMFIAFCIIGTILPEKHRKEEDLEEYLK